MLLPELVVNFWGTSAGRLVFVVTKEKTLTCKHKQNKYLRTSLHRQWYRHFGCFCALLAGHNLVLLQKPHSWVSMVPSSDSCAWWPERAGRAAIHRGWESNALGLSAPGVKKLNYVYFFPVLCLLFGWESEGGELKRVASTRYSLYYNRYMLYYTSIFLTCGENNSLATLIQVFVH